MIPPQTELALASISVGIGYLIALVVPWLRRRR